MGLDLIEWTYDPLQALNAHLNFARLGVVLEEYEENIYGESSSPLHRGAPTDRFVAAWRIDNAARRAQDRRRRDADRPRQPGAVGASGESVADARRVAGPGGRRSDRTMGRGSWWRSRPASIECSLSIHPWRSTGVSATREIFQTSSAAATASSTSCWRRRRGGGNTCSRGQSRTRELIVRPEGRDYPGGQVNVRPPSTWRWMWNTVWPASALVLKTVR